jgi:hypothetical protein
MFWGKAPFSAVFYGTRVVKAVSLSVAVRVCWMTAAFDVARRQAFETNARRPSAPEKRYAM